MNAISLQGHLCRAKSVLTFQPSALAWSIIAVAERQLPAGQPPDYGGLTEADSDAVGHVDRLANQPWRSVTAVWRGLGWRIWTGELRKSGWRAVFCRRSGVCVEGSW